MRNERPSTGGAGRRLEGPRAGRSAAEADRTTSDRAPEEQNGAGKAREPAEAQRRQSGTAWPRCSLAAEAAGDPLEGTAPPGDRWLLVEHPGPWPAQALTVLPAAAAAGPQPVVVDRVVVRSADQTPIVGTLVLPPGAGADTPVPVVLQTHGWGGSREKPGSNGWFRATSTAGVLQRHGYAVFTWDSRGFGESGGEANVAAPGFEVKDAQAILDMLASRDEIAKDAPGDPKAGWAGGSNAGGVQFNTAAVDRRVDAIAPEISWGYLPEDLVTNGAPKLAWDELLYGFGFRGAQLDGLRPDNPAGPQAGAYAREIHQGHAELAATGAITKETLDWYAARATTAHSSRIETPTLIIQGSIDTLFPLQDAFDNYTNVRGAGTPVKLMTYCSGHTLVGCKYPGGATGYPQGLPEGALPVWQQRIV